MFLVVIIIKIFSGLCPENIFSFETFKVLIGPLKVSNKNINKWWFKNQKKNQETFYVNGNPSYNVNNECYYKTQELINTQLKLEYPNYDFYDIKTNMNAQIYDKKLIHLIQHMIIQF